MPTTDLTPTAEPLHAQAQALATIATDLGLPSLGTTILQETTRRLEHGQLRVLVVGEIKQGKSTLINALLGQNVLPSGVTPTTGAIVQVIRGETLGHFIVAADGTRSTVEPTAFAKLARGKTEYEGSLLLTTPSEHLPDGIELIDTPGINDLQRFRSLLSRGELPRGDAIILVLDATQVLKRTELAFLRDILLALGGAQPGTERTGAALLVALNRIDLVPDKERATLLDHIHRELQAVLPGEFTVFQTDARGASKDPTTTSLGVREISRLRAQLLELATNRPVVLPTRTRASLQRYADLLLHHTAVSARALRLESEVLARELAEVRDALSHHHLDREKLEALLLTGREDLAKQSRERLQTFRSELEASILGQLSRSDLRETADILPSAVRDALLHFSYQESERLRLALEQLSLTAIHTCGEQAQRRLAATMLTLGLRGPVIYLEPPSVGIEASTLAVGIAGTAIMYFGSMIAGIVVTITAPMATMFLRERSIRNLRNAAKRSIPLALRRAFTDLENQLLRAVDDHLASLREYIVLAHNQLGTHLEALLARAAHLANSPSAPAVAGAPAKDPRQSALATLRHQERQLEQLRDALRVTPA